MASASPPSVHPVEQDCLAQSSAGPSSQTVKPISISSLMSPPELPPFESFQQSSERHSLSHIGMGQSAQPKYQTTQQPPSPPISPWTPSTNNVNATSTGHDTKDPILYPDESTRSSSPLFVDRKLSTEAQNVLNEHLAARRVSPLPATVTPPAPQDYGLVLCFQERMMQVFMRDQAGWLKRERAQLQEDNKARKEARGHSIRYIKPAGRRTTSTPVTLKPRPSTAATSRNEVVIAATGPRSPSKVIKFTSRPARSHASKPARSRRSITPEPRTRVIPPNREDRDFNSIPDYCPPVDSLPNRTNCLKVDWKGNTLDLSNDPNRHLLHPDELQLAASLRLDCATYLTSKRRIFQARLNYYRSGKEFRKTHAQQACKIDVNKASKLHVAFEKVGWFNKEWMRHIPQ